MARMGHRRVWRGAGRAGRTALEAERSPAGAGQRGQHGGPAGIAPGRPTNAPARSWGPAGSGARLVGSLRAFDVAFAWAALTAFCMFSGPLRLAPLVTFVVATSPFTVAGIGSAVWALIAGLVVAVVVELPDLWTF